MVENIITNTDEQLAQFEKKLLPANQKFNQLLSNKVLDWYI